MSYLHEGLVFSPLGVFLAFAILPVGGLVMGAIGFAITVVYYSDIKPGSKPPYCGVLGHDWRAGLVGGPKGKTCRNCVKRSDGQRLVRTSASTFGFAYQGPSVPGYDGGPTGYVVAARGYVPAYVCYAPPQAPYAGEYAPPPPVPSQGCRQCGFLLPPGQSACARCGYQNWPY